MRVILAIVWMILLGGAWKVFHPPSDVSWSGKDQLQFLAILGWLGLFAWGIITYPNDKSRAIWLICGFILYSLLRLVLFAMTDYDHQRRFFLILTALVVGGVMLLWRTSAHQNQQTKENVTDDRQ